METNRIKQQLLGAMDACRILGTETGADAIREGVELIDSLNDRLSSATQENERLRHNYKCQNEEVCRLSDELAAVKALVPSDHCVVPRSLVVDVMCYGEDGKVLEAWMVGKLESALLGAFPEAKQPAPAAHDDSDWLRDADEEFQMFEDRDKG